MGHHTCCTKQKVKRGLWSSEEDEKLINYITTNGHGCWSSVPRLAGLQRCGKSCRLRWINYLRPDLKRGSFSPQEAALIIELHRILGNRWSQIAKYLPGRTDNEVKNFWNSSIKKKLFSQTIVANNTINTLNPISNEGLHLNYHANTTSLDLTHDDHNNVGAFTNLLFPFLNNSIISPNLIPAPLQASHNHQQISHNSIINMLDQSNELIETPQNMIAPNSFNSYDPTFPTIGLINNHINLHQFITQDHHQQESCPQYSPVDQTIMRTKLTKMMMEGIQIMPKLEAMASLQGLLEVCSMPSSSLSHHHHDKTHDVPKSFQDSSCMLDQQLEYYNYVNNIDEKSSCNDTISTSPSQASLTPSSFTAITTIQPYHVMAPSCNEP